MKVTRSTAKDGNLLPPAFNLLHSDVLPASALHHKEHRLRHPQAIYTVSLARVHRAFVDVLDSDDELRQADLTDNGSLDFKPTALLKAQEELLEAMLSHIDDCYHIFKAMTPSMSLQDPNPFADRWLRQVKHPTAEKFTQAVEPYRKSLETVLKVIQQGWKEQASEPVDAA